MSEITMTQLACLWALLITFTLAPAINQRNELRELGANDSTAIIIEVTLDPHEPVFMLPDSTKEGGR